MKNGEEYIKMGQIKGLEDEYFTWEDWGCCDLAAFNFNKVTLKKKIGGYEKGTKFECVVVNYGKSVIEFWGADSLLDSYKISLNIEEKLK